MNSDDSHQENNKENSSSNSRISSSDSNANLNSTTDESKGAIPKVKPATKAALKKSNNNLDDLALGGFSQKVLHKNGYSVAKTGINCLNNTYEDSSDPDNEDLSLHLKESLVRKSLSCERSSLNIPIENDYLSAPFGGANNSSSCSLSQRQDQGDDEDSSSDDNELLSVSDDGCIYTYKGDQVADLPSSFFNLEIPLVDEAPADGHGREENNSSPEMDFLEMDFDPGPSGDADSDSISNTDLENAASLPLDQSKPDLVISNPEPCCSKDLNEDPPPPPLISSKTNNVSCSKSPNPPPKSPSPLPSREPPVIIPSNKKPVTEVKMPWSCTPSERTRAGKHLRMIKRHHNSKGELTSPSSDTLINGDLNNLTSFHNVTGKWLVEEKSAVVGDDDVKKAMVWTNQEACLKQITQVGPSACGATAVLNVLNALRFPIPTLEKVQEVVKTRLRANSSPLTEYLLSRSKAGCSHRDIIDALYDLSNKQIYSRFFHMWPERLVNLQSWLGFWIENGAVPVATINLQKCDGHVPDSWHHQMIYGVGPEGIYLTNPLECVDAGQLWPQLTSDSVLLIKSEDVISRWDPKVDLPQLLRIGDVRWKELNVVGQVAKLVRQSRREHRLDHVITSHIRIPAEYRAGITLALDINSPGFSLLRQCPELPLLQPEYVASAL